MQNFPEEKTSNDCYSSRVNFPKEKSVPQDTPSNSSLPLPYSFLRKRLYNDKAPILHELRSLVDTGYSFIDASMTDRLRDMFSAIDAAAEENGQVNMTAVFVREERGRQRFDAVLVDKCENYWPDVGDTHMTYYDNDLPEHIMGKLAMLSMLNDGAYVHNVGYRINSRMFYVAR